MDVTPCPRAGEVSRARPESGCFASSPLPPPLKSRSLAVVREGGGHASLRPAPPGSRGAAGCSSSL